MRAKRDGAGWLRESAAIVARYCKPESLWMNPIGFLQTHSSIRKESTQHWMYLSRYWRFRFKKISGIERDLRKVF